jgi:hypothetical protein
MAAHRNKFAHVKIVMAGFLTTKSLVRSTSEIIYRANYAKPTDRQKAVMNYFYSLGVPTSLKFGDFAALIDAVFPAKVSPMSVFPINIDYDQDNCQYAALVKHGVDLDNSVKSS